MDEHRIQKLRNLGAISRLSTGAEGVRVFVAVQTPAGRALPFSAAGRPPARVPEDCLRKRPEGTQVDLAALSVSGQTVEAVLPVEHYDRVVSDLEQREIRVDELIDRQVVLEP